MNIERVCLDLDRTSLYVARFAAEAANLSLDEWISKVARAAGMEVAAAKSAEKERMCPDDPPGWAEEIMDRMFREDDE